MTETQDRRQARRFSFAAAAVVKTSEGLELASVRVVGLGMAGCRIESSHKLDRGEEFELTIRYEGEEIVAQVVVVYWHPAGFAGLHFTSMSEESRERLERLVEHISRTSLATEGDSRA